MMQQIRPTVWAAASVAVLAAWGAAAEPQPPAQGQAPSPPAASRPAKPDPGQVVVCRDEQVTGSIVSRKRVCKTRREWDEQAQETQRILEQDKVLGAGGPR
jgi:hypothetical protein